MRISWAPYVLTIEDAERLRCLLIRTSFEGARSLRDLRDRHRFQAHQIEAVVAAEIVRID